MTMLKNTTTRYGAIAKLLHWSIGIAIISMLGFGVYMKDMDATPLKWQYYGWHKATGIIILSLVALRLAWKIFNTHPALPRHMSSMQRIAAQSSHLLLYIMMFYMPLTGWLMSSAGGYPITLFGLATIPPLIDKNPELGGVFNDMHTIGLYVFGGLLVVHIGASLIHHFYYKDNVLTRMLPSSLNTVLAMLALSIAYSPAYALDIPVSHHLQPEGSFVRLSAIKTIDETKSALGVKLTDIDADIRFNKALPLESSIHISAKIDETSIEADMPELQDFVFSEAWLHGEEYDSINIHAREFERLGGNSFRGRGTLDIRGVEQPIQLSVFSQRGMSGGRVIALYILFDRTRFGLGKDPAVDSTVTMVAYLTVKDAAHEGTLHDDVTTSGS